MTTDNYLYCIYTHSVNSKLTTGHFSFSIGSNVIRKENNFEYFFYTYKPIN